MRRLIKQFIIWCLNKEAALVLRKYKPKVIAITGTVGKTSTKDAIQAALVPFVYSRKSPKSFNSEFGVPLTVLGTKNPDSVTDLVAWGKILVHGIDLILMPNHYPEWLVLEVGTDRPGDIKELTKWLRADIVVVTRLSEVPVHVEAFDSSPKALFREKGYLVEALKPGGTLLLNSEDKQVLEYKNSTDERIILFGNGTGSTVRSRDYVITYDQHEKPTGVSLTVEIIEHTKESEERAYTIATHGTLGAQHASHVLAALAVCHVIGEDLNIAVKALASEHPTPGRMRIIEGEKGTTIIDDSYNSSPIALREALKTLKEIKKKRGKHRIAVLGDMLELGKFSIDEHRKAGELAAKYADALVAVGVRARRMAEAAQDTGMSEKNILQFDDSREAGKFLQNEIKEGDIILVKGSQGVRMERVVEELMAHPEDKQKLLVRQDTEWQMRG